MLAIPAYPGARLWADTLEVLYPGGVASESVSHYSSKRRLNVAPKGVPHETEIGAVLFLLPDYGEGKQQFKLEPFRGAAPFVDLVQQSFMLDSRALGAVSRHFRFLGELIETSAGLYGLHYPHDFERLADVHQAILECLPRDSVEGRHLEAK